MADGHPMLSFERALWDSGVLRVAGVDEAGRGPLAGPVVAAAVIFSRGVFLDRIRDSKRVPPREREALYAWICENAGAVSVAEADARTIDEMNILRATVLAMKRAVAGLSPAPGHLIIDGRPIPDPPLPQTAVVRGDARCFSVAAASIVAKVTRDRLMVEMDARYPGYGFARHKGYGTEAHVAAIRERGPCEQHRRSFRVPERWGG